MKSKVPLGGRKIPGCPPSAEPHDHDEDVTSRDGEEKPDAHPEPASPGKEKGRPQEPGQADEPEKNPASRGSDGNHTQKEVGEHSS